MKDKKKKKPETERWKSHYKRTGGYGELTHALSTDGKRTKCNRALFDVITEGQVTCRSCMRRILEGK